MAEITLKGSAFLTPSGGASSGFTRAKKLADLAIKTNTDDAGNVTAYGYEQAIGILSPYITSQNETQAIDAQRLVAGYNNSLDKLTTRERDITETVSAFKLQEQDAYFSSFDGDMTSFRDPGSLVGATSEVLDGLLLGVVNAIEDRDARGLATDQLYNYLGDLQKRADAMRDLSNKYETGQLTGASLDGFGYFVDTNPVDGSIRGAAIMPIGMAPEGMTSGYKRLDATADLSGGSLPVYAPAVTDASGQSVARVGGAVWSGTGSGALAVSQKSGPNDIFQPGGFNLRDSASFPTQSNEISNGEFVRGFAGYDEEGNPSESLLYRGVDGKYYQVDDAAIQSFANDPILGQKLNGYIKRLNPSEMRTITQQAQPMNEGFAGRESRVAGAQSAATTANAERSRLESLGFFGQVKEGLKQMTENPQMSPGVNNAIDEGIRAGVRSNPVGRILDAVSPVTSFFTDRINNPNKPDQPKGQESFLQKAAGFFRKQ